MKKIANFIKRHKKITLLLFFLLIMTSIFLWYQNNHIVIGVYHYQTSKISGDGEQFRIVQISDLHNARFGKKNQKLIREIEGLQPDLIVITGDIVDSNPTNISIAVDFVREIAGKYPVYYVTGNHEYWLSETERKELFEGIQDAGAVLLNNEKVSIDVAVSINGEESVKTGESVDAEESMDTDESMDKGDASMTLIGLDDNHLDDGTLHSMIETCDKEELTVVLAHEPQYLDRYSDAGADLVITGHAHGGQMILPFVGPLIAPDQGFFPEYTAGEFTRKDTTMYISRGLGNSVIPVRLFNYPEIVCIEIQGAG